jgi:hypothetical protein
LEVAVEVGEGKEGTRGRWGQGKRGTRKEEWGKGERGKRNREKGKEERGKGKRGKRKEERGKGDRGEGRGERGKGKGERGKGLHTTSRVAGLVVAGEIAQVEVLEPGDPDIVLFVVLGFGPLHFCCCGGVL